MITQCPYCARQYKANPAEMGKVVNCACGKAFVVQASDAAILLTPAMKAPRPDAPGQRPDNPLTAARPQPQRPAGRSVKAKTARPPQPAKTYGLRGVLFFLSCTAAATIIVGVTWKVTTSDAVVGGGTGEKPAVANRAAKAGPVAINKPKPPAASRPVAPPPEVNPATASGVADPTSAQADPPVFDPKELDRQRLAAQQVFEQVKDFATHEQNEKAVNMLADMLNEYPQEVWPKGALDEYDRLAGIVSTPTSVPTLYGVQSPE